MDNNHDKTLYDVQFAALMHALGGRLGADAVEENAALQKDPAAAVPESVRRRCMETIARHGTATARAVRRVFLRIAVAALVTLLLFATAFAVSPTLREKTIAFFKEIFDTHTEFRISEPSDVNLADYTIETGWLPEGMELVEDICGNASRSLLYKSENGSCIRISIFSTKKGSVSIDSEHAIVEPITINGQVASLVTNENSLQIIFEDQQTGLLIRLLAERITKDLFLYITEKIDIF